MIEVGVCLLDIAILDGLADFGGAYRLVVNVLLGNFFHIKIVGNAQCAQGVVIAFAVVAKMVVEPDNDFSCMQFVQEDIPYKVDRGDL